MSNELKYHSAIVIFIVSEIPVNPLFQTKKSEWFINQVFSCGIDSERQQFFPQHLNNCFIHDRVIFISVLFIKTPEQADKFP